MQEEKSFDVTKAAGMCSQCGNLPGNCRCQNEKLKKEQIWERASQEVEQIGDKLGKGIDEGVKESVVALTVNEYPTVQSCEGHLDEEGLKYPWIQVEAPAPEGWQEDDNKKQAWTEANLKQRERITAALNEFYQDRKEENDSRLMLADQGIYGAFRLKNSGSETMESLPREQQEEKQGIYRKEMGSFTEFLKKKYFEET